MEKAGLALGKVWQQAPLRYRPLFAQPIQTKQPTKTPIKTAKEKGPLFSFDENRGLSHPLHLIGFGANLKDFFF